MLLLLKIIAGVVVGSTAALLMGVLGSGLPISVWVGSVFGLYTAVRL